MKGQPAFPIVAGNTVEALGMTQRQYYAAHAPEVPEWFKYKSHPHDPGEGMYVLSQHERSLPGGMAKERELQQQRAKKHEAVVMAWRIERIAAWRFAYADALIEALAHPTGDSNHGE